MSLESRLDALVSAIGADIKGLQGASGGSYPPAPTYAGARLKPFDTATSWYNLTASSMHAIRANMAKADAQRVRITAMGHSMLAGSFASQVGATDAVAVLRRYLQGLRANVSGTGLVKLANNTSIDYRWVLTGSWTRANGSSPNDTANAFAIAAAANSTAVFTSDMAGTIVDVATFDNTASMQIFIDNVLMETYAPAGSGANVTRTFTGLSNSKHVVKIVATTSSQTYLVGVNVRNAVGIEVNNMGQAGSQTSDWVSGVFYINRQVAMASATPNIAILQLDTNEVLWGGPMPIATYKTNYGDLISAIQATGAAVIMIASPPATGGTGTNGYPAVSQATWESYVSAEYDLADQYNVPLLDLNHMFISQPTASSDGLMGDPIHPNDYGYGLVGRSLGRVVLLGESNDVSVYTAIPAVFSAENTISVRTGKIGFLVSGGTYVIDSVMARVGTASVGAAVIVDINKNGATIYGTAANRPTIPAGSSAPVNGGVASVTTVTTGDILTVDIDQVGSTTAGGDLSVVIMLRRIS